MSDAIITVENLGKCYRLGAGRSNERYTALRDVISENVKGVFKKLKPAVTDAQQRPGFPNLKSRNGSDFSVGKPGLAAGCVTAESQDVSVSDVSVGKPGLAAGCVTAESQDLSVSRPSDEFWALKRCQLRSQTRRSAGFRLGGHYSPEGHHRPERGQQASIVAARLRQRNAAHKLAA